MKMSAAAMLDPGTTAFQSEIDAIAELSDSCRLDPNYMMQTNPLQPS